VRYTRLLVPAVLVASFILACSSSSSSPTTTTKKDSGAGGDGRANPYPSFKDDVMAVVVVSCALTACHGSKQSNLNIYLPGDPDTVFAELQKTSPTANMKFVTPGDPKNSYFMLKIDGEQATASCGANCGTEMPPADTPGTLLPKEQRDAIRDWISAGAKND
jgi:hypothetical protein